MFSWITGPRIANAIEELQADAGYETTFIEAPETPAHQFAVKAFKHAIFGTPAPEDMSNQGKQLQKNKAANEPSTKVPEILVPQEPAPLSSPSKQPGGILRTPVTASKGRKTVSFGAHVVDNEGKRGNVGKSGIPNDCPGKFPSPWTPGTELKTDTNSEKKPRNKLTEALLEARTTTPLGSGQKPKAKDDSDITMDLNAPRSESGKYWKQQFESYAEKSEKEVKKLVAKQQMAKNYAKKKDGEVTELITKLEQERKRYRRREHELEQQNKEFQERLRQAIGENLSTNVEITALKNRIATLEKSLDAPFSEAQESKPPFHIYEDSSKDALEASYIAQKARFSSVGKENSPPKFRHTRHRTMPEVSHTVSSRLNTETNQVLTTVVGPFQAPQNLESATKSIVAPTIAEQTSKSPLSARKTKASIGNSPSKPTILPSSPLPQPSPGLDPWLPDADESSFGHMDRMAVPISSAPSYSKPVQVTRPGRHRVSTSVSQATGTENRLNRKADARVAPNRREPDTSLKPTHEEKTKALVAMGNPVTPEIPNMLIPKSLEKGLRPDNSNLPTQLDEGSSQVKRDRSLPIPASRRAEAQRRLQEKKQKRLSAK